MLPRLGIALFAACTAHVGGIDACGCGLLGRNACTHGCMCLQHVLAVCVCTVLAVLHQCCCMSVQQALAVTLATESLLVVPVCVGTQEGRRNKSQTHTARVQDRHAEEEAQVVWHAN
jgi:hypothetical protein